jgi:hypothetical protein
MPWRDPRGRRQEEHRHTCYCSRLRKHMIGFFVYSIFSGRTGSIPGDGHESQSGDEYKNIRSPKQQDIVHGIPPVTKYLPPPPVGMFQSGFHSFSSIFIDRRH